MRCSGIGTPLIGVIVLIKSSLSGSYSTDLSMEAGSKDFDSSGLKRFYVAVKPTPFGIEELRVPKRLEFDIFFYCKGFKFVLLRAPEGRDGRDLFINFASFYLELELLLLFSVTL